MTQPARSPNVMRCTGKRAAGLVIALFVAISGNPRPANAEILSDSEFRRVGDIGFGDPANGYAWSMAEFKGKVYIGTNHNFLCLLQSGVGSSGNGKNPRIPGECGDDLLSMDFRGRIYEYDPITGRITLVHIAPTVTALLSDGTTAQVPSSAGYRTMAVYRDPDGTEALYVGGFGSTALPLPRARILRTTDGRHFTEVALELPGTEPYRSFRAMTVFKNRLYMLGLTRDASAPVLLESDNPSGGVFRGAAAPDFGDSRNDGAFDLAVFAGHLYVGTFSPSFGFQLLKTKAEGTPPYPFQQILVDGAYRGIKSQSVLSLKPFHDHLYVGTGIYFGSINLFEDFKPAPAEVLRVAADDSWEIVVGDERMTPDGFKKPITGIVAGFGNPFVGYIWRMTEYNGTLYLGTLDTSVFAQFAEGLSLGDISDAIDLARFPRILGIIAELGPDELADVISAFEGGFDLWATQNGTTWRLVTRSGFGDEFAYGIRTLLPTSHGLFVGTANPFFGCSLHVGQKENTDADGDSFPDAVDNCPGTWNLSQHDLDGDGIGDECDADKDGDCIDDSVDNDLTLAAPDPTDTDQDDIPDACDNDIDGDGVLNHQDNCPLLANLDQSDTDNDGIGDVCDVLVSGDPNANQSIDPPAVGMCGAIGAIPLMTLLLSLSILRIFALAPSRR